MGKLNLLITNGDMLFVHSNMRETLYYADIDDGAVTFCTKPILNIDWKEVPNNRVLVYQDGEMIYKGKKIKALIMYGGGQYNDWAKCFN